MKPLLGFTSMAILVGFFVAGCSRVPPPLKTTKGAGIPARSLPDVFKAFYETARYPDNPRPGDDWIRFREGIDQLAPYFAQADVRTRIRLTPERRAFLEKEGHLDDAELSEVGAMSFRVADAHYLDECFLLRDAARAREVRGLSPIRQAKLHFDWVMRNVMLFEQGDTWVPPAFTLRRGYGNAIERALVLLALLRQAQIEGCVIAVPDADPLPFLVGVLDDKGKELYLFDTRLGLPLRSKDGRKILTLKEARAAPALLGAAQITPEQAKKLEAWLVCPLYAMAPRFTELQAGMMRVGDPITLFLDAKALKDRIAAATDLSVKVWNPPAKEGAIPNSPTRCLRLFLPKQDGDLDETSRAALCARERVPMANVEANLAKINVTKDVLPADAFAMFPGVAGLFFEKYDQQARELFLRGQFEQWMRRQERLQAFANDDALVGLADDPAFRKDVARWRGAVTWALANRDTPGLRNEAQQALQETLSLDGFMLWLLQGAFVIPKEHMDPLQILRGQLDKENRPDQFRAGEQKKPTLITKIFAVGMRDYFDFNLARSRALIAHDRAALAQAALEASAKPNQAAARDAWAAAYASWSNGYVHRFALSDFIEQRLAQLRSQRDFDMRVSLLETLHQDLHKYFQARMCMAECGSHLEDRKIAPADCAETKRAVEGVQKGALPAEIKALADVTPNLPPPARAHFRRRLDLLALDWGAAGKYAWMLREIEAQLKAIK